MRSSIETSGNRKEPILVSKLQGLELPTCLEQILPYVMEHYLEEKWLCAASFGIPTLFETENDSNRSIDVGNV